MKKVIIALTAIVAMASCKKENVTTVNPTPAPIPGVTKNLVKSVWVYENGTPETETYTYDTQGRLASYSGDAYKRNINYQSATQLLITVVNLPANTPHQTIECTINGAGAITTAVYKNNAGALIATYTFVYDTDGHMVSYKYEQQVGTSFTFEVVSVWVGDNHVSAKRYDNGIHTKNYQYLYDNTKIDKAGIGGAGGLFQSKTLFGKKNKNLLSEFKIVDLANTITWHTNNTWSMDADGYPTKETVNYIMQGKQGVNTFTYQ